jgi:hypothetical protein
MRPPKIKLSALAALAITATFVLAWAAGCGGTSLNDEGSDAGSGTDSAAAAACPPCVTDNDCNGGTCVQGAADNFCAPGCPNGNECTGATTCAAVTTVTGKQVSTCVPQGDLCGAGTATDAGTTPPSSETCGTLVGPDVHASCACAGGSHACNANGCYGGWWCDTATNRCQQAPSGCSTVVGKPYDGGTSVQAQIDNDGGTASRLYFAIIGDTRPASNDDTAGYPTPIITKIFTDIGTMSPSPPFSVSTGDYMFASASGNESAPQLDAYLGARAKFPGKEFPTMGNHECTGATASNCGTGNTDGVTTNMQNYLSKFLATIGKTQVYYEIDVNAPDSSWTSKFLFVAGNAWDQGQATWLDQAMSRATTYTFVIRHEPADATTAPGVGPSEAIMAKHPYTLAIVGHSHKYASSAGPKAILIGNGGAPMTSGQNYGFGIVSQRADGALAVDEIDYQTGLMDPSFHFVMKADGTLTQ